MFDESALSFLFGLLANKTLIFIGPYSQDTENFDFPRSRIYPYVYPIYHARSTPPQMSSMWFYIISLQRVLAKNSFEWFFDFILGYQ